MASQESQSHQHHQQQHAVHRLHRIISQVQPHSSDNHLIQHLTSSSSSSPSSSSTSPLSETEMGPPRGTAPLPADPLRFLGWGYRDTTFYLNPQGQVALSGSRYLFSGRALPSLRAWMEEHCGLNISYTSPPQSSWPAPSPIRNESFLKSIEGSYRHIEWSERDRIHHSHGHTAQELFAIRHGALARVVDVVIYPGSHAHVETIIKAATQHNVAIIPFGGGTSVSHALVCDINEKRMIVSLDMHMMNAIKHVNRHNMTATIEAGAVGKDIDRELRSMGLVLGHEPDSSEFSTMGGWIATRASGMRKNKYGNIEDIIVHIKMVTPTGTVEKSCQVPRISAGPDIHQMILGSEGTLGVVTEAVVRLRPAPQVTLYGSMIFPCFEDGVACMHAIAMARCAPVSIRLVDNTQFQFGQALKPATEDWKKNMIEKAKKWYVLHRLKFDPNRMVAATLLFEGTHAEVAAQEKQVYSIAAKYGGMKAGEDNGVRGYFLTYMIAYLRDFGFAYSFLSESFETSCPWDRVLPLCTAVKQRIRDEASRHGIGQLFVSCRVTQTYDTGACVYFYFGFVYHGLPNPVHVYESVEHAAREEILAQGGSISHHHGIGKLRASFMDQTVGTSGMHMLRTLKQGVDPKNIMAAGNLNLDGKAVQHGKH